MNSDPSSSKVLVSRLYRGSCMSVHVLLNLLNELGKRDKMRVQISKKLLQQVASNLVS